MSFKFSLDNSHQQSFIFGSSIRGTQRAQTFLINRCSRKIVLTEPVLMPTASAISCTLTRRFCNTVFSTARQFSSQTASDGCPDQGSSSRLFLPWRNSAA